MITVSLRRQGSATAEAHSGFWDLLKKMAVPVLPNTAGCHSPQEVIATARMAREVFETDWIKLELIGDDYTLLHRRFDFMPTTCRCWLPSCNALGRPH